MEGNIIYSLLGNNFVGYSVSAILIILFITVYALIAILAELKISAWMQRRYGPWRNTWHGVGQPLIEVFKLLQKENVTPDRADKVLFNLAPFIVFIGALMAFAVIPFGEIFIPSDLNIGIYYAFAVSAFGVVGIIVGGWSSHNKYSLLGSMRAASQMVSYEIPISICLLAVATLNNSLDMSAIVSNQSGFFWNWNVFGGSGDVSKLIILPFTLALFIMYFIATLAETNRTPFDLPEGESELVAGYSVEYSGMKFAMFYLAEYTNMFIVSALMTVMFLGGWNSPFGDFLNYTWLQPIWFILKAFGIVVLQIIVRWTLPRLRVDQLMHTTWKVLLPFGLVCFFVIALYSMVIL
ncbi:MAG: NADH-quinone oxidoreductase subunit NuoH [Bacteroidetes bacterium]|nr:NADH-quinone oxidoreductase subunit NuoH [Bacteroidota bacterium]MBR3091292.1 NADH-quinone oxidoreductase subunit NuoH [Bacteroidota bacterium]